MELIRIRCSLKCMVCVFILLCPSIVSNSQSSIAEIDQLYELGIKLEATNLDSTYLIANLILKQSMDRHYEKGKIKSKILASYYFWDKNKIDTAKSLLNECIAYYSNSHDEQSTLDYGRVRFYYGLVTLRSQELKLAKKYGTDALKIFEITKDQKHIGNALNLLGSIEMSLDNYPGSLEYYSKAYKTKLAGGEPVESCGSEISNIAMVYWKMGVFDKALEYAHESLSISFRTKQISNQINSINTLGSIHSAAGNTDSAFFYFNKCRQMARAHNRASMAFVSEYNIANMYSNGGRYSESNSIVRKLLKQSADVSPSILDITKTLLAKNFLRLQQFDSAILIASPLLRDVINKENKQSAINISEILWQAFEKTGKHDSSFHYLLEHFALKDSVYNIENQRKLSTLYAEMETIEKQSEIEVLEKDKILQKARNQNLHIILGSGILIMTLLVMSVVLGYKNREKKQQLLNLELQTELDQNKKTLHQQALRIIYINNGLIEIEKSLKKIKTSSEGRPQDIQQILNTIHLNKSLEKEWKNFNEFFGNVHGSFITQLNTLFPELTTTEKRLSALIKMNLTNREIGSILNIEPSSVKMAKYRLKKKLLLTDEQDIHSFLHNLDQNLQQQNQN